MTHLTQRISRIIFVLFLAAGTIRLSAQMKSSDVGISLVDSELASSTITDDGDDVSLDFDEEVGFGLSFNHFWTDRFSTEIAAQKYSAALNLSVDDGGGQFTVNAGKADITSVTAMAQMHFRRATRFAPYIGAGFARIWGDFDPVDDPETPAENGSFDLEAKTTWTAAVGANMRLTDRVSLVGEIKYIPWEAIASDDPTGDRLNVDPTTFATGVKIRF
jgi:outer membrane protein W